MRPPAFASLFVALALASAASPARAQSAPDVDALYLVAKKAFDSGRYDETIRALEECHRISGDATFLWRIGYAAEKSYWAGQRVEDLKKAVASYRTYLAETRQGPKRASATQALAKLEPLMPKDAPVVDSAPPPAAAAQRTGVMVSSSTPGALIELDDKLRADGFLEADVEAGLHKLRVRADGYATVEREVPVKTGALVGLDIQLDPLPALLEVHGPEGAAVSIDGEPKGALPLARPLSVTPGQHLITVEQRGAHPMTMWKKVERGTTYDVPAELETTGQRYGAWATLSFAVAAGVTAGALTGVAFQKQADANAVLDEQESTGIPVGRLGAFDDAIAQRDALRTGAGVAWGLAAAGATSGIFLFLFDNPSVQAPPAPVAPTPAAPTPVPGELGGVEVTITPDIGAASGGFVLSGRF